MQRQLKKEVKIGNLKIGGTNPIAVQTMLNVPVKDIAGNVAQAQRVAAAGCQIVRVTVPTPADAAVVAAIKEKVDIPVVADIHFDYRAALAALDAGADKIRINPGNIGDDDRVKAVADACNAKNIPIRIGVNGGSLEKHILAKYGAPVPEAMVESAMYHVRLLQKFDFDNIIKRMVESNTLYLVIKEFGSEKGYLGPDKISAVDCGYIFEDLVRRFSESFGEEAGAHFTSRDIIYLMTDLLLSEADLDTSSMTVYDMAMGTSQMLSCMEERIHELNSDIEVTCFGQEFNPSTFAIAKADMMIRGGDPNNMRFGDTLSEDQFPGFTFQYIISNPPFGIDWKREQKAVEAEAARGEMGRFAPGLPKISDGQQLFVLNGLAKLANKGKMAIIQNGSPLFSGDAGSGPSNIRQYILENDWLDCIIQLSTDMFMNTGISTYIWVLSKDKPAHRAGKVQLIDASHCFEPRRKSIGTKRNDITDACRELIVTAYGEFANGKVYGDKNGIYCESKVFESVEFGYNKIVVERPQRDEAGNIILKRGKPVPDTSLRDTENVPLVQDIDAYFAREVLPYAPDAWIDHSKTKVGYEIPMTRYFYEYQPPEAVDDIVARITALEQDISAGLAELFHKEG